jgi:hypothetical protein
MNNTITNTASGAPKLNPDTLVNTFDSKNERPAGIPSCTWVRQYGDDIMPVKEFKVSRNFSKILSDLFSKLPKIM